MKVRNRIQVAIQEVDELEGRVSGHTIVVDDDGMMGKNI